MTDKEVGELWHDARHTGHWQSSGADKPIVALILKLIEERSAFLRLPHFRYPNPELKVCEDFDIPYSEYLEAKNATDTRGRYLGRALVSRLPDLQRSHLGCERGPGSGPDGWGGVKIMEQLSEQVKRLGAFILENVPGEPSQSEGAIDCAIRIIRVRGDQIKELEKALLRLTNEAQGFVSMADPVNHGYTNIAILNERLIEARAALKKGGE